MRTVHLPILILLILLSLPQMACKKINGEGTHRVTGQVVDKFSEEPVPGAHVELLGSSGPGSSYGVVDTFPTDKEGCFDFRFQETQGVNYDIRPAYYEYYDNHGAEKDVGFFQKNKNHTLELHPLGWVKVNFINEPPLDTAYNLSVNGFNNNPPSIMGVSIDTCIYGALKSKFERSIYAFVTKGGNQNVYKHEVYMLAQDTISITVKY